MIHATATGSYAKDQGDPGVLVGILDTGVDGSHPDIAPNFSWSLSRNFVTDMPVDRRRRARSPAAATRSTWTTARHGTHVAGTIGAALNGLGIAGVAPKVTIVNIRAGQDSGFFFLQPSIDALTYAADIGVDVINMSYFIDPWLFNCPNNPADSPDAAAGAADDHRGDEPGAALRAPPPRHADRGRGQRALEPRRSRPSSTPRARTTRRTPSTTANVDTLAA